MQQAPGAVLLFDGVCNLCNGTVQLILEHDAAGYFRFAPLQSAAAAALLAAHGTSLPQGDFDSVLLVEGGKVYSHSDAALRVARHLDGPLRWLWVCIVVPRPVRDAVYRLVARNRYRWFGRTETCRVPTPALRARFLA